MAYDEALAARFRAALIDTPNVTEKKMMGGVCFLINGNMVGGADRTKDGHGNEVGRFMFRLGKDNDEAGAALPGAQPMIQGGRRMRGFFFVDEKDCSDEVMRQWRELAVAHASSLPIK